MSTYDERPIIWECSKCHARREDTPGEKSTLIQSMHDDLNGIYPLPKLKREVIKQRSWIRWLMNFHQRKTKPRKLTPLYISEICSDVDL